jgi:peroxiredoxin
VALVAAVVIVSMGEGATPAPLGNVRPGDVAPEFSLEAVRGGTYTLSELLEEDKVVLLSFINTQAEAGGATADPSRSQIVFLRSMDTQYASKGMQVLIVDAASTVTGRYPEMDDLINFTYDWNLDTIPVLVDDRAKTVARAYGVTRAPVTFLVKTDGKVDQLWEGFASAPQLAFALQALVGYPDYATSYAPTPTPDVIGPITECDASPAQAIFAGLAPARSLSDNVWVVDGGRTWQAGNPIPLTWVILGADGELHLEVTVTDPDSGDSEQLVDASVSPVPEAEAEAMLISMPDAEAKVHLHIAPVELTLSGCLQIEAVVTQEGEETPLYTGNGYVPVD